MHNLPTLGPPPTTHAGVPFVGRRVPSFDRTPTPCPSVHFMHRLRSRNSVARFKIASWILVIKWMLISTAGGILIYSLIVADRNLSYLGFILITGSVVAGLIQWSISAHARCPLCLTPPISHRGCSKHRSARRVFGSYRLHVAFSVIFWNRFRCPYCGEWTAVEVRLPEPDRIRR